MHLFRARLCLARIASGSGGVAAYINFDPNNNPTTASTEVVQGRLGYLGPDYVLPSVANTGNNNFGLSTASLVRPGARAAISPTPATTLLAYGGISAPTGAAAADTAPAIPAPGPAPAPPRKRARKAARPPAN